MLLTVHDLRKLYGNVVALAGVSFTLARGATLGIVGASGSGKSTLARCVAGFDAPSSGEIQFAAERLQVQLIFQQPAASLNPRFTAAEIVEEPLLIQRRPKSPAAEALAMVGIGRDAHAKRADQFSGGECQRLAIARALVLEPKLLVLDESLNGLDPALSAQVCSLLKQLQQRLGLSYIVISHDLDLVAGLADQIAVMESGRIVELAPTELLMTAPQHPHTRGLIAATVALR
ncbi:MAG TPA: ATP-binding cassette domain-containing protein [Candidatus Solibacter sp.]|jgi:ABC-type glutathione transport system ATPase component